MLVWLCLAAGIAYVQRQSLGVVEIEMRTELGLTKKESAWIMTSGFFVMYALFQVPAGWVGHVWGSRRALSIFAVACSAATSLCYFAVQFPVFLLLRCSMGLSQAGLFPCTTGTMKNWFPYTQWGLSNGMLTAFQQMGGAFVPIATGYVAAKWGWRWTFPIFAMPGLLWAAWFLYWFRDRPDEHSSVNAGELAEIRPLGNIQTPAAPHHDEPVPWGVLLLSPALAMICTQQFFRGAAYIFYSTWFATYLRDGRHVEMTTAAWLTSLPLWANAVGCLAGGGLSDWLLVRTGSRRISRQGLAVASQLACATLVFIAYPVVDPTIASLIISLGSFCAAAGGPIAYAVTIDMGGNHVRPVFSLMNMWGNLGSLVFPLVLPFVVGEGKATNWDLALPLFGMMYAIAGVCWLGFNPNRSIVPEPPPADSHAPSDA